MSHRSPSSSRSATTRTRVPLALGVEEEPQLAAPRHVEVDLDLLSGLRADAGDPPQQLDGRAAQRRPQRHRRARGQPVAHGVEEPARPGTRTRTRVEDRALGGAFIPLFGREGEGPPPSQRGARPFRASKRLSGGCLGRPSSEGSGRVPAGSGSRPGRVRWGRRSSSGTGRRRRSAIRPAVRRIRRWLDTAVRPTRCTASDSSPALHSSRSASTARISRRTGSANASNARSASTPSPSVRRRG